MKRIGSVLGIISSVIGTSASHAQQGWPLLPSSGFISGRPAVAQDVFEGNAVFVAEKDGKVIGKPIPITIPQYAYWMNETGTRVPVIVVQAEEANGQRLVGFRDFAGKDYAAFEYELKLLGTTPPR